MGDLKPKRSQESETRCTPRRVSPTDSSNVSPPALHQENTQQWIEKKRPKLTLRIPSSSQPSATSRLQPAPLGYLFPFPFNMLSSLSSLSPRQLLAQALNFALVLSTAFMLWKGLSVATDSPSPIVVVLSGSMEPAFQRGDLLFLWNRGRNTQIGEIVVYNVKGKDIPIVHRVVRRFGGG